MWTRIKNCYNQIKITTVQFRTAFWCYHYSYTNNYIHAARHLFHQRIISKEETSGKEILSLENKYKYILKTKYSYTICKWKFRSDIATERHYSYHNQWVGRHIQHRTFRLCTGLQIRIQPWNRAIYNRCYQSL